MGRDLYGIKGCEIELHNDSGDPYLWDYVNEVHIQQNADYNIILVFCQMCDDKLDKSHIDKMIVKNRCKNIKYEDFIRSMEFLNLTKVYSSFYSSYEYPSEFVYAYTDNFSKVKESNIKKDINTILDRRHISECMSNFSEAIRKADDSVSKAVYAIKDLIELKESEVLIKLKEVEILNKKEEDK